MGALKKGDRSDHPLILLVWLFGFLAFWEIFARYGGVNPLILPPFSKVVLALAHGLFSGSLLLQLLQSIGMVAAGLTVGLILALGMAYLGYFHGIWRSLFQLLSAMLHPLPGIALLPVVVLMVGVGLKAVFIIVIHAVVWALYLNLKMGYETVEPALVEVARNHGASDWQLFYHVLFPCGRAAMVTGIKVGWSRAWRALISAEMVFGAISSVGGLGWYLYEKRAFMDTEGIYAGLLLVVLVGVLVEQVVFKHTTLID